MTTRRYALRNDQIENFFAKLKPYRAIDTRYDKLAETFLRAIYMAATIIWLI
jgi:transposase